MKTIFLIVYLPGYGGNFLRLLYSIDKSTFPWVFKNKPLTEEERTNAFYFSELIENPTQWYEFHRKFHTPWEGADVFLNSDYQRQINIVHPMEFYKHVHNNPKSCFADPNIKIQYLGVHLDVLLEEKTRKAIQPSVRFNEFKMDLTYKRDYKPFIINFDNFLYDDELFLKEYKKVNDFLKLPNYDQQALDMWHVWKTARKI